MDIYHAACWSDLDYSSSDEEENRYRETTVNHYFKTWRSVNHEHFKKSSSNAVGKTIKHYDVSHEDCYRKGRPRVTSAAEDTFITVTRLRNCSPNKCCHVLTLVPFLCLHFSLVRVWVGVGILCFCISVLGLVWFPISGSCLSLCLIWEPYLGSLFSHYDLWIGVLCFCTWQDCLVFVHSLCYFVLCSVLNKSCALFHTFLRQTSLQNYPPPKKDQAAW